MNINSKDIDNPLKYELNNYNNNSFAQFHEYNS